ncbi:hypothetical protein Pse7367_0079 [Thalassoporum mexicanum PCC 7367]|uniref:hypothetical protein n=1 Tax=Thalassoporum mexicanum TaxID=3457544 RepID=UPI00029F9075|nr:hypothetical protein [Pseudanabaena sp. PCC 7367]AFY68397.1 hypothetical protein Pse7367_0079 [Pseudanabaena sp. PCC 7367]
MKTQLGSNHTDRPAPDPDRRSPGHDRLQSSGDRSWLSIFTRIINGVGCVIFLLSIPGIGLVSFYSLKYLTNPESMAWLLPYDPPQTTAQRLNPPQTLKEIKAELAEAGIELSDRLYLEPNRDQTGEGYYIYALAERESKEIIAIRVYQPIVKKADPQASSKLDLVSQLKLSGMDEYFVKSPNYKYSETKSKLLPGNKRLPLNQLQKIEGDQPSQGFWFMVWGKTGSNTYGKIFSFTIEPQPTLNVLTDWTSPIEAIPKWQHFSQDDQSIVIEAETSGTNKSAQPLPLQTQAPDLEAAILPLSDREPELIINQSQAFEPSWAIFKVTAGTNLLRPLQLRQITLNEGQGLPKAYSNALILASGGLWSPALVQFDQVQAELIAQGKQLSPYVQEQYDLIKLHAKYTKAQAGRTYANAGQQVTALIIDGRWEDALTIANNSDFTAQSVAEALNRNYLHLWRRVEVAMRVKSTPEIKTWGALILLQKQGFPTAQRWLIERKGATDAAIAMLQRYDLSPLGIQPEVMIGTISPLGDSYQPSAEWFGKHGKLLPHQAWYEVSVSVLRDGDRWRNAPFNELAGRSPLVIWEAFNLDLNNFLTVNVNNEFGQAVTESLNTKAIWIGDDGQLRLLAVGDRDLSGQLTQSAMPAMVSGGGLISRASSFNISVESLGLTTEEKIIVAIYNELQSLGQVSIPFEDFRYEVLSWTFKSADLTGDGRYDYVLEIDRSQIDLGDRHYPMVVVFDSQGDLIFSDIVNSYSRRWISLLPGSSSQILTEVNGRYEAWSLQ